MNRSIRPVTAIAPNGRSWEALRCILVSEEGLEKGSNGVVLQLADGRRIPLQQEGPVDGVCPPVSDWMRAYVKKANKRIASARKRGKTANLQRIRPPGNPHPTDGSPELRRMRGLQQVL